MQLDKNNSKQHLQYSTVRQHYSRTREQDQSEEERPAKQPKHISTINNRNVNIDEESKGMYYYTQNTRTRIVKEDNASKKGKKDDFFSIC